MCEFHFPFTRISSRGLLCLPYYGQNHGRLRLEVYAMTLLGHYYRKNYSNICLVYATFSTENLKLLLTDCA